MLKIMSINIIVVKNKNLKAGKFNAGVSTQSKIC